MKYAMSAVVLLVAGCNQVPLSAQHIPPQTKRVAATPKPTRKEDGLSRAFRDQNPPSKVPPTARTIKTFRCLKLGMTRREVISKVGMPDKNVGSGLYVDIYKLSDGSVVTLGSGGTLIYAYHQSRSGKSYELLKGKSQPK